MKFSQPDALKPPDISQLEKKDYTLVYQRQEFVKISSEMIEVACDTTPRQKLSEQVVNFHSALILYVEKSLELRTSSGGVKLEQEVKPFVEANLAAINNQVNAYRKLQILNEIKQKLSQSVEERDKVSEEMEG